MLNSVQSRTFALLIAGLVSMAGAVETASASCSIKQVCEAVEKEKKKLDSTEDSAEPTSSKEKKKDQKKGGDGNPGETMVLSEAIKDAVESHCDDEVHNSDCPLNQVIELCWENKTKVVVKRCKD